MRKRVQFHLSDSFYALLEKHAAKKGLKPHEFAKRIVVDALLDMELHETIERKRARELAPKEVVEA